MLLILMRPNTALYLGEVGTVCLKFAYLRVCWSCSLKTRMKTMCRFDSEDFLINLLVLNRSIFVIYHYFAFLHKSSNFNVYYELGSN